MQSILQRFIGFDRLLGPVLVKFVYYFGIAAIIVMALGALLTAIFSLSSGNIGEGATRLIAAPVVAAVSLVYWRFLCELFMLAFRAYERLGEVRDSLRIATGQASAPDPDHPEF
jgi:Domain of unknown function (DUF4282)